MNCLRVFAYKLMNLRLLLEPLAVNQREESKIDSVAVGSADFIFSFVTFYSIMEYLRMSWILCKWGLFRSRVLMFCKFRPITSLYCGLCIAVIFCIAGGCSREHYKAEADKEVYKIIDGKWQDSFGLKVNYKVSDVPPSANDVQIENTVPPSGIITLAQAVAMATAHNREYQIDKESLYLSALSLTGTRHQYARQWFGTIDYRYEREGDEEKVSVGGSDKGLLGFDHEQLLGDGLLVTTKLAINWARYLTGDPRTSLGSVLSASVTVPLLGAGAGKAARENLTQAERDVLYDIRSFNRYRKTFVVGIVTAYYNVLQLRDVAVNAENNYQRMLEWRKRLEMEADEGQTARYQVDQAKQTELSARDSWIRAQQSYQQKLDEFKIKLVLPTSAKVELDENELEVLVKSGIIEPDYTLDAAIETALLWRLDLINSMDKIDDATRNVVLAAEGLGPQLNLTGKTNEIKSPEGTDFSRLQFHRGKYELFYDADFPLDRKNQRNAYRVALIELERQQRDYDDYMDKVELEVRDAHRKLQQEAKLYRTQQIALELAKKRVDVSPLLWEAGRLNTRDFLESQDALLEAQNRLTSALVAHLTAKLNFFLDVGVLQVRLDGMWEQRIQ